MTRKPTYEELKQIVKELEKKVANGKSTEEALRREHSIFIGGPVVVFRWAPTDNWPAAYVSPNVTQFGYQANDFISGGILYINIIDPEDLKRVLSEVEECTESGAPFYEQEYRIIQADGETRWVHDFTIVRRNDRSEITHYDGYILDITDRKRAEEALQQSEEFANAALNATSDMVYLIDVNGNVLTVNDTAARNFGKTSDELIGTNVFNFFHPDIAKSRKEQGDKVIQSGKPFFFEDKREGRFFHISIYPTLDAEGKVDRLAVFVAETTERKQAEEALLEAHDRLEKKVESRTAELTAKAVELEKVNSALEVLLRQREKDRLQLEEKILTNIRQLVTPHLQSLKNCRLDTNQMALVNIAESNLNNIVSPLIKKLSSRLINLTPTEIRIADFIKEGQKNKEIAELLRLSLNTVKSHRYQIRAKLGLKNKKMNLQSYLLSLTN